MDQTLDKLSTSLSLGKKPMGFGHVHDGIESWRTAPLRSVVAWSPIVAVARLWGIPWGPFVQSITAQLVNSTDTVGPVSFQNNADRLSLVSVVDAVVLHMDVPNLNAGNAFKPFIDWFFTRQSGIQSTIIIDGAPRWVVGPDFVPIDTLVAMINEQWAGGWVLGYTQTPKMQFVPAVPLLAVPVTVNVTFRMWQPTVTRPLIGMTDNVALEILVKNNVISQDEADKFVWE